ncbi:putative ribonuclease H-like domain-containing protein [Tanacetum coccineum]
MFVELLEKRKKHFAVLRAKEKRKKPPTIAQKKSTMSTYLKHIGGYKHSDELEQEKAKKQKGDDDQEEEEIKKHIEIVQDDEVAIDAIPLATKPLVIFEWNIIKEGKMGYFKLIRAYGSSKRYSSMISNTSR